MSLFPIIWTLWAAAFGVFEVVALALHRETLSHYIAAHSPFYLTFAVLAFLFFHFAYVYLGDR
jgi:hypothetical protein